MKLLVSCTVMLFAACQGGVPVDKTGACAGPLGEPLSSSQLGAMTSCCQAEMGHAHCLAKGSVPTDIHGFLAACDSGGYCIPDAFLETGAAVRPKQCTAFGGPGVCLSR